MQFSELKTRGWWAIEDDATNPNEITDEEMGALINDAYMDIAPELNLFTKSNIALTSKAGTLPSDFIEPLRLEWKANGKEIRQIHDINDVGRYIESYFIGDDITIYTDASIADNTQVTLYYKKYPTALSSDNDVPLLPLRFHPALAEVFVKAKYALRKNMLGQYNGLMLIWDDIKREVNRETSIRRNANANYRVRSGW
jgi:hypothetical protein